MTPLLLFLLGQIDIRNDGGYVGRTRGVIDCRGGLNCSVDAGVAYISAAGLGGAGGGGGSNPTTACIDGGAVLAWTGGEYTCSSSVASATAATALAANPSDCSANQFANAIAANGNLTCSALADADVPNSITVDLAATATALAANPADCGANTFAQSIAASGALTCAAISDSDVPNNITVTLAATATALASNPTDCGGGQYATAIDASGNLTCSTPPGGGVNCITYPLWSWVAQIGNVATTTSCTATTNLTNEANRGHQIFVDMDRYTHAKLRYFGNVTGAQTGTVTVKLRDIAAGTDAISTSWNTGTGCVDRSSATTDLTAKTGVVPFTARLGDSNAADDPALSSVSVEFCTEAF